MSTGAGIPTAFRIDMAGDGDVIEAAAGGRTTGDGDLTLLLLLVADIDIVLGDADMVGEGDLTPVVPPTVADVDVDPPPGLSLKILAS